MATELQPVSHRIDLVDSVMLKCCLGIVLVLSVMLIDEGGSTRRLYEATTIDMGVLTCARDESSLTCKSITSGRFVVDS